MIKCQNSIVTINVRSVHRQLQHKPSVALRSLSQHCRSVPVAEVAPDNLKRLLKFGDCLRLCFKLAVNLQHCTPRRIVQRVHIRRIWRPLVFGDEIWTAGPQPVLCAARRCALCVLTHRTAVR